MKDHSPPAYSPIDTKIILVEDDQELSALTQEYLIKNDFQVEVINNGLVALNEIVAQQPDLVILDIMLPGLNGMDVCRQVRPDYAGFILMLTALDEDMDQMLGLELGADDYIIKPVKPRLLLSRIRALLRRKNQPAPTAPSTTQDSYHLGELHIHLPSRVVTWKQQTIDLSTAEFDLLVLLAKSAGEVVDRDMILQTLRGFEYDGIDRSIDRRISRLRKKLQGELGGSPIKTIRGKGYLLSTENFTN